MPWYKNFTGVVEPLVDKKYIIYGEISIINESKLEITELPIGSWTQTYKESVLEPMLHGANEKTPPSITYVGIQFYFFRMLPDKLDKEIFKL